MMLIDLTQRQHMTPDISAVGSIHLKCRCARLHLKRAVISSQILAFVLLVLIRSPWSAAFAMDQPSVIVSSPDGNVAVTFEVKPNPQPYLPGERAYYRVAYKGLPILVDSPLGLDIKGMPALSQDFEIEGSERESHDSTWEDRFGARRRIRDHYNQLTVSLRERRSPGRRVQIIFRAYNEGVAFRYFVPKQETLVHFTISAEETGFFFGADASAFALDLGRYDSNYEGKFLQVRLSEIGPSAIIGLPLLVNTHIGAWVAILEADVTDYSGMYLGGAPGLPNGLLSKLSPRANRLDEAVIATPPKATPWRVLLVNSRPGGLIESDYLILNLSSPSKIADTSWITVGNAVWQLGPKGISTASMKHFIDFAAEHQFPYVLTDVGWASRDEHTYNIPVKPGAWLGILPEKVWWPVEDITRPIPAIDLPDVLAYAKQRNVKVLLWIHWTSAKRQMDQAFPLYEKMGLAGLKVDFMDDVPDNQETVNLYEALVRKAALHHLVIDIHGAFKPTGLHRAYPNLLSLEAVIGLEYSSVNEWASPDHDVTLPFTRMLAGPMDYTPGCFTNRTRSQFKPGDYPFPCQGTRAHQLAMYVVFLSPLGMLADPPNSYDNKAEFEFLKKVPTTWDETRVLNGEPAKYVTIARKRDEIWYVGSMTNWDSRDLDLPLDFLGPLNYDAQIFADGTDADSVATSVSITTRKVTSGDKIRVHLAPGGGLAMILSPSK